MLKLKSNDVTFRRRPITEWSSLPNKRLNLSPRPELVITVCSPFLSPESSFDVAD